ncbi:hypothetical protein BG011_007031 [Mortierella polycephala]|uniref:Sucrose transporter n=1 Tax=Mortierella polycephala TaxID=41804 RepID=A0A9P6TYR5_9FUNG|nr:hypothetical protein BG011_007031 [Mortierella polycephala]
MSLVWLAGPLSGLVMQPVVGVLSDKCTSRLGRRRPFLMVGVSAVVVSFICLGWCKEIMSIVFGADYANLEGATILMAVGSIYILDFAINCVQASCRTLIVDSLPSSQQEAAASWASRLMGLGGIFGYFMGNVNLPELIPLFGDTQIKGLCVIACIFLVLTVGLTCLAVTERYLVQLSSLFLAVQLTAYMVSNKKILVANTIDPQNRRKGYLSIQAVLMARMLGQEFRTQL